ncbi:MAG: hypothetical protein FJ144_21470 [Deltaproteobacteria bacterium]|nr:hypothetical protein [Deltaproteobacteria bacterium]
MGIRSRRILVPSAVLAVAALGLAASVADADPSRCQSAYVKQLLRLKVKLVRFENRCLDQENDGNVPGPCPDLSTAAKISDLESAVRDKIVSSCSLDDATALGFPASCNLGAASDGAQEACAALPVSNPTEFADCLICWKKAELQRQVATTYGSHAVEVCGGDIGGDSTVCSSLGCTSPLPDQRNLGETGESECQRGIAKGSFKYLVLREKALERCALTGADRAACLADARVLVQLARATEVRDNLIQKKCGNRDPVPSPPFCCRTGMANACSVATSREDCEDVLGGSVQEGKICDMGTCGNAPGNKSITWWGFCPQSATCPGTPLSSLDDLKSCVGTVNDAIIDELMCLQFRGNGGVDWPCPPGPPSS